MKTFPVTCNISADSARKYGRKSFALAIGRACRDIGVFVVGAHGRRMAYIHGEPVRMPLEAHRILSALEMGIVGDFSFTLDIPEKIACNDWCRLFGASFDDANSVGD